MKTTYKNARNEKLFNRNKECLHRAHKYETVKPRSMNLNTVNRIW
jgi:hypothetical protein